MIEVQTWHLRSVKGIISFPMEAILYRLHSPADDDSMIKRLNSNDADEEVQGTSYAFPSTYFFWERLLYR